MISNTWKKKLFKIWLTIRKLATGRQADEMPGFDKDFYLSRNPDVAKSGTNPLQHYLEHGWREGREPSAGFSGQRYLALNPDVMAEGINPLVHYLKHGLIEGRLGACAASSSPTSAVATAGESALTAERKAGAYHNTHAHALPTRLL
ncbi:hypothetical protein [Methylorubrum aminovorans]